MADTALPPPDNMSAGGVYGGIVVIPSTRATPFTTTGPNFSATTGGMTSNLGTVSGWGPLVAGINYLQIKPIMDFPTNTTPAVVSFVGFDTNSQSQFLRTISGASAVTFNGTVIQDSATQWQILEATANDFLIDARGFTSIKPWVWTKQVGSTVNQMLGRTF